VRVAHLVRAAALDQLLLPPRSRVVRVAFDAIHVDDRQHHVMPDARSLLRGEQVPGCGAEELPGCGGVLRGSVGDVDDRGHPDQLSIQPRSSGDVHPS
jgi:hypothetical protein